MEDLKENINYSKMSESTAKVPSDETDAIAPKKTVPVKPKEDKKARAVDPYEVGLLVNKLNVRKGPAKKMPVVEVLEFGTNVTIVIEKEFDDETWGKIEDRGWINLGFVKRR